MPLPVLATKLYAPPPRPDAVLRPRLIEQLNQGLSVGHKLTLISASAGFGKTTLVSEWVIAGGYPAAWLSLDAGDSDPTRFLTYLIAALQTIAPTVGDEIFTALQSPQPPSTESILTTLLNDITTIPDHFIFVLDDYHVIDAKLVDQVLTFLLEHLPPQMHLVIATREDPHLPLARLRTRGQLTELRAADLRFSASEAAEFLKRVMGQNLSAEEIAALETRTEGWIAGLQLAALSMRGRSDTAGFIQAFTGSHHFVLDYLIEEVLQRQSEAIQTFLLRTSILDRFCGPLCDAVLRIPVVSGQEALESLERANLFIVPLDNERHWYRYHHLFADLLRQRLGQSLAPEEIAQLHIRASQWYEDNNLHVEAFQHAVAANDIERAERLIEEKGMPLHFRSVAMTVLDWLVSLPTDVLDTRPRLRVRSATLALVAGQTTGVEERLQAAEAALAVLLQGANPDEKTRDLIGQIACARATLALTQYETDAMITQSRRALEYLHPANLTFLTTANWTLGVAYLFDGNRVAARQALTKALSISQASGDVFSVILATSALGQVQESSNQLHLAVETYRQVLSLFGDHPQPNAGEMHLGLARIFYEWNDLDAAEQHGQQALQLSHQYDEVIDRFVICEVILARLKLARGDVAGAAVMLAEADQAARQRNFVYRIPEVAAAQVIVLLRQGELATAAQLAQTHALPLSRARVLLAQGEAASALAILEPLRREMEARDWADERLKAMVLQAVAFHAHDEKDKALQVLGEALTLAEPEGFIRTFIDEGTPMVELLTAMRAKGGRLTEYILKLLAACGRQDSVHASALSLHPSSVEPLSQRELEVLRLIAQGLSNQEISTRLFLALDTVKGHNRRIFEKLQVQRRTEAVARARELGLL